MQSKKLPIVEVEWYDAHSLGAWRARQAYLDEAKTAECRSVGYLLKSNRDGVTLLQSLHPAEDKMTDSITIPRGTVKSVRRL